jgi:hypothetical protein
MVAALRPLAELLLDDQRGGSFLADLFILRRSPKVADEMVSRKENLKISRIGMVAHIASNWLSLGAYS